MKDPSLWPKFVATFSSIINDIPEYKNKTNYILQVLRSPYPPNILLYSAPGFPLDLLWIHVATTQWGEYVQRECTYNNTIVYNETPYYFDIDFQHPSNNRALDNVQSLIKTIVTAKPIHMDRHVLVCRNIEALSDIYAFRVLLERFSKNALFVCQTHKISSIEAPIKSRFFEVRLPLFSVSQVKCILNRLGAETIINTRNIYKALYFANHKDNEYTYSYPDIATIPIRASITNIRELSNKVCNSNVPFSLVVVDLLHRIPEKRKHAFVQKAAEIEHRMMQTNLGRKPLYYELLFHVALWKE